MTLLSTRPQGYPAWRETHRTPADLTFEGGLFCPVDTAPLRCELAGWVCPRCLGWWDRRGRNGMWLATPVDADAAASSTSPAGGGLLDVAPAVGVVVEPAVQVVQVDPVVPWRLLFGWAALLAGPGAAVFMTGRDLAGYADVVPDGSVYAAAAVITAVAVTLIVHALVARRREVRDDH
jgi:hypothetical protein